MPIFDKLQPASFRGVQFFVDSSDVAEGRKKAVHDFVNTDTRYVEDLGQSPQTFTVRGFVHGANALQLRDNLRNALNQPGLGILVHPDYGQVEVAALPYTSSSNYTETGMIRFDMTFARSEAPPITVSTVDSTAAASSQAQATRDNLAATLEDVYKVPTLRENVSAMTNTIESFTSGINSISSSISPAGNAGPFFNAVRNLQDTTAQVISDPNRLASSFASIFDLGAVIDDAKVIYGVWRDLTNYGADAVLPLPITLSRIQRRDNTNNTNDYIRLNALTAMHETAAAADYVTVGDLQQTRSELEEAYNNLVERRIYDGTLNSDNDIVNNINDLRVVVNQVLEEKEQQAYRRVDINADTQSISLVTYQYYGNLDNYQVIRNLNIDDNVNHIDDTAQVLTR